jgi:hypothetical protein
MTTFPEALVVLIVPVVTVAVGMLAVTPPVVNTATAPVAFGTVLLLHEPLDSHENVPEVGSQVDCACAAEGMSVAKIAYTVALRAVPARWLLKRTRFAGA